MQSSIDWLAFEYPRILFCNASYAAVQKGVHRRDSCFDHPQLQERCRGGASVVLCWRHTGEAGTGHQLLPQLFRTSGRTVAVFSRCAAISVRDFLSGRGVSEEAHAENETIETPRAIREK